MARARALDAATGAELDGYIHVSNLLAVLQAEARRSPQK